MTDYARLRTAMVDCQVRPSDVTKYPIIEALLDTPREAFVPRALRKVAYAGEDVPLGAGRVVLDPRVFAKMLDALNPQPQDLVLHIGAGLGYGPAVLSRIAGTVIALEDDAQRAGEAQEALSAAGYDTVVVETGPLAEGMARHAPYDLILIEGGVEEIPPALAAQLKPGGRIVALFMQGELGVCRVGTRAGDAVSWRSVFNAGAPVLPGFEAARSFAL